MLILNEDVKIIIDNFFDIKPEKLFKIYQGRKHGDKAEDLFKYCGEKDNLIILFEDKKNNKFGGFISKKLPKDNSKDIKIRDEKAFLFSLKGKKKFKVLNPENAVFISKAFPLCFGGKFNYNDLYTVSPFFEKDSGMYSTDTYGDKNYEISNGQSSFKLKDIIIYQIEFFD